MLEGLSLDHGPEPKLMADIATGQWMAQAERKAGTVTELVPDRVLHLTTSNKSLLNS